MTYDGTALNRKLQLPFQISNKLFKTHADVSHTRCGNTESQENTDQLPLT